jgi:predicted nucleic acid-binding protein
MINIFLPRLPFTIHSLLPRLYFDSCCLSRPFDVFNNVAVQKEAYAVWGILDMIKCRKVDLAWSDYLTIETKRIRDAEQRFKILDWQNYAIVNIPRSQEIRWLAREVQDKGIHKFDALHIASAIKANCQFFVTTDYRLQKYHDKRIYVCDPIECLEFL